MYNTYIFTTPDYYIKYLVLLHTSGLQDMRDRQKGGLERLSDCLSLSVCGQSSYLRFLHTLDTTIGGETFKTFRDKGQI